MESQVTALENMMDETNEQIAGRVQNLKSQAADLLTSVENKIRTLQELPSSAKSEMTGAVENLKLQLALGKAAAKDSLNEQKQLVSNAAASVKAHLIANKDQLSSDVRKDVDDLVGQVDSLKGEMEAAAIAWKDDRKDEGSAAVADFNARRTKLKLDLADLRASLRKRKDIAGDKLGEFNTEMEGAFAKIGDAFRNLS